MSNDKIQTKAVPFNKAEAEKVPGVYINLNIKCGDTTTSLDRGVFVPNTDKMYQVALLLAKKENANDFVELEISSIVDTEASSARANAVNSMLDALAS